MKVVSTSIEIEAPVQRVWQVLTEFSAYPAWNPFIRSISGSLTPGEKLAVQIKPPGGKEMKFRPTVLVSKPSQALRWKGRLLLPGFFDGEHFFGLKPTTNGTLLEHSETFSGIFVSTLGAKTYEQIERGFRQMNQALKARAES